jgi:hypothetical protein
MQHPPCMYPTLYECLAEPAARGTIRCGRMMKDVTKETYVASIEPSNLNVHKEACVITIASILSDQLA